MTNVALTKTIVVDPASCGLLTVQMFLSPRPSYLCHEDEFLMLQVMWAPLKVDTAAVRYLDIKMKDY